MSAALLVILVGAWVVVLVPMWLSRHDAATEVRSVDRFSTAMRTLSRRPSWRHEHAVLMPARAYPRRPTVDNEPLSPHPGRFRPPPDPAAQMAALRAAERAARAGRARLLARRRRMMIILAGLVVVSAVLAGIGVVPLWAQLILDLLAFVYLVHVRNQARQARERRQLARTMRRSPVPMYRPVVHNPVDGWSGEHPSPALAAPSVPAAEAPAAAAASASASAWQGTAGGNRWEPVPVPLPTYVSKPQAPRRPAASAAGGPVTIDLTRPGKWSEEHLFTEADRAALDAEIVAAGYDDGDLDHILERRPAVGD